MHATAPTPTFRELYLAWRSARRRKRPSHNQLAFEARWLENLMALRDTLRYEEWWPTPAVCFITTRPKAREIHAPDFADRVVHHWLVPRLETLYEPVFIHDSYSNRKGKGTHAAVARLQVFMRQVRDGAGCGKGWCLQLDIKNFFNRIHRPTLYELLKRRLLGARGGGARGRSRAALGAATVTYGGTVGFGGSDPSYPLAMMRLLCHRLLARHPSQGVRYRGDTAMREAVPPHKRLANAPEGCGLPIGNLTSQFFANVYLNELDQFVKHRLKCKRYLRYVDDFVLVHESREQLVVWQAEIERFLAEQLRLELKADVRLGPIDAGVDFLGYHLFAHGRRLRKRVVSHCRERLDAWQRRYCYFDRMSGALRTLRCQFTAVTALRSQLTSYQGHFAHAGIVGDRVWSAIAAQYPWLKQLFIAPEAGNFHLRTTPASIASYAGQVRWFRRHYPQLDFLLVQRGSRVWVHSSSPRMVCRADGLSDYHAAWLFQSGSPTAEAGHSAAAREEAARIHPGVVRAFCRTLEADGASFGIVAEYGWLRGGMRRRVLVREHAPPASTSFGTPLHSGIPANRIVTKT